jgi:hypothetical protein
MASCPLYFMTKFSGMLRRGLELFFMTHQPEIVPVWNSWRFVLEFARARVSEEAAWRVDARRSQCCPVGQERNNIPRWLT